MCRSFYEHSDLYTTKCHVVNAKGNGIDPITCVASGLECTIPPPEGPPPILTCPANLVSDCSGLSGELIDNDETRCDNSYILNSYTNQLTECTYIEEEGCEASGPECTPPPEGPPPIPTCPANLVTDCLGLSDELCDNSYIMVAGQPTKCTYDDGCGYITDDVCSLPPSLPPSPSTQASLFADPHLTLAHGGKADFRGVNGTIYAFVSSRNLSMAIRTEDATFKLDKLTVEGSFMTGAFFVARTDKGRFLYLSYETQRVNNNGWSWRMVEGDCARPNASTPFALGPHARRVCDNVEMEVEYSSLRVTTADWEFVVTAQPVYGRIVGPRHRLDVKMSLFAEEVALRPHGLVGQSFDGDNKPRHGKIDVYPSRTTPTTFRTMAMAEGAIDGVAADYVLAHARATSFAYSRFSQPTGDVRKATHTKVARATNDSVVS